MGTRIALCIMAKAPEAGRVKTRLCPPLSADDTAAADLARLQADLAAAPNGPPRHTRRFVLERLAGRTAGAGGCA